MNKNLKTKKRGVANIVTYFPVNLKNNVEKTQIMAAFPTKLLFSYYLNRVQNCLGKTYVVGTQKNRLNETVLF